MQHVKKTLTAGKLKISYHHEDLNKFLLTNEEKNTQNTFYSFSDILSFCDFEYLNSSIQIINNQLNTNHSGVFRAFIRNRFSNEQAALLQSKLEYLTETSAMERTRMYQVFNFKI